MAKNANSVCVCVDTDTLSVPVGRHQRCVVAVLTRLQPAVGSAVNTIKKDTRRQEAEQLLGVWGAARKIVQNAHFLFNGVRISEGVALLGSPEQDVSVLVCTVSCLKRCCEVVLKGALSSLS